MLDDGVEYLVKKHPEILRFQLVKETTCLTIKLTSTGLNEIFSLPTLSTLIIRGSIEFIYRINVNIVSKQLQTLQLTCDEGLNNDLFLQILEQCGSTLKSLTLKNSNITGEILIKYKGTLPCLENLELIACRRLTDKGLLQILQLCGSTLTSLDIGYTKITGESLSQYKGTLPCLENLNMRNCRQLTNGGLLHILQLCGSTLRSLNISGTNITGENLSEYKGTLPCLETLNMMYCEQLTDNGLLQILQLCGSTLRTLDISGTNITGENLSEYKGTLPCLENLNIRNCSDLTDEDYAYYTDDYTDYE
ncbi:F-box protein At3g58530 [Eurytemora carolleeae]|uniref:F-box protein At3g58530 n=1 Tax=Eurytemora carolleeae TaxID=1294199 RepID=UPI000C75B698|nr:F-box protein At3g58530 [Eurytemora carolleeae]|eukprot:XP_023348402.1 F-box protein At3g58530-like [Eurytemora affinis]